MYQNVTIHLAEGDMVDGRVNRLADGSLNAALHIDGAGRLAIHASDPTVLYELAVRVGALAAKLDAAVRERSVATTGLTACRAALSGDYTEDDDARAQFEQLVDTAAFGEAEGS